MDTRPQIERSLSRARVACIALIAAGTLLGGAVSAAVVVWLTKDRSA